MSKYSLEFKLEVVKYCIEEHHGTENTARKFGIPSSTPIKEWIRKYKEHGPEGLLKHLNSSYSGDFKQSVIEYMHKIICLRQRQRYILGYKHQSY